MINFKVKTLSLKSLGNFWAQKSRHHCLIRDKMKCVLASKSHWGKHENMWNQVDNNFERKKILKFFEVFEFRNLNYVFSDAQKMDLCRNMLDRKGVLATKSHRGKYENMWNQIDNNFERKKFWKFFEIFEVRNFEIMSFYMAKNGFVSWYAQ